MYIHVYMYTKSAVEGEEVLGERLEVHKSICICICKSMLKTVYVYSCIYVYKICRGGWKRFWRKIGGT
jgi:hypothetical protein